MALILSRPYKSWTKTALKVFKICRHTRPLSWLVDVEQFFGVIDQYFYRFMPHLKDCMLYDIVRDANPTTWEKRLTPNVLTFKWKI